MDSEEPEDRDEMSEAPSSPVSPDSNTAPDSPLNTNDVEDEALDFTRPTFENSVSNQENEEEDETSTHVAGGRIKVLITGRCRIACNGLKSSKSSMLS